MTEKEIVSVIKLLKAYYPYYYRGITPEEAQVVVNVWKVNFGEYDYELVEKAVHRWGKTNKQPPTIADIRSQIYYSYTEYKYKWEELSKSNEPGDKEELEKLDRFINQAWNAK